MRIYPRGCDDWDGIEMSAEEARAWTGKIVMLPGSDAEEVEPYEGGSE